MKIYIKAMSKSRSDIRSDLEQNAKPCMEHLAKLWLFPAAQDTNHWRKEIANFYSDVDTMKPKNKVPKAQFIFDSTWGLKQHLKEKMVQKALDSESEYVPDSYRLENLESLYLIMEKYFIWMSETLSDEEYIPTQVTVDKLIELGL